MRSEEWWWRRTKFGSAAELLYSGRITSDYPLSLKGGQGG